jgi:dTMP kinase
MERKGVFIAFEGIDGSGKSTQAELLVRRMVEDGVSAVLTREHTLNGAAGRMIERVVTKQEVLHPRALQYSFVADRIDHSEGMIKPAMEKGQVVVSDRYYWSTVAYGAAAWDRDKLLKLNQEAGLEEPDLWVLVDIDPRVAMVRMSNGRSSLTIFEKEDKLRSVRQVYSDLAARFEERTLVVDGDGEVGKINDLIYREIAKRRLVV